MRVLCDVINIPSTSSNTGRPSKGAVSLGTLKLAGSKNSVPHLSITTATKKNFSYALDGSTQIQTIMDKFCVQGKATIQLKVPSRNIFISNAKPDVLRNFVLKFRSVLKGEKLDEMKEIQKITKNDLNGGPRELIIGRKDDYPSKDGFPSSIKKLSINRVGLQRVDGRWFALPLLTHLDFSHNLLHKAPDLVKLKLLCRLTSLQVLSLADNGLTCTPTNKTEVENGTSMDVIMSALPSSLLSLNISHNRFDFLPQFTSIPNLLFLDISHNQISVLPYEFCCRPRLSINADHNRLGSLPYIVSNMRDTLSVSGNILDEPRSSPSLNSFFSIPSLFSTAVAAAMKYKLDLSYIPPKSDLMKAIKCQILECNYCRKQFPREKVVRYIRLLPTSLFSIQSPFRQTIPTSIFTCYKCYCSRSNL